MSCLALVRTDVRGHTGVAPNATPAGYGPSDIQSAYNLASAAQSGGSTVAVVDAYNDPDAASDLATYRAQYGLAACDTATGAGCVTVVNEQGSSALPAADSTGAWEEEESLDIDMVSAVCPNCHVLLVEASSTSLADLGAALDYAAGHADFVSNSWGGSEFTGETYYDGLYLDHPGIAITFAAGDYGYGPSYPAVSRYVTSVGGTTLARDASARGWSESVWSGTGSGCSALEPKPAWQVSDDSASDGCLNRTDNDVSAVADPNTPVAVYDTFPTSNGPAAGWQELGGTSASAPIIASVYALAGAPIPGTYPASYSYQNGHAADLYDVVGGNNGTCEANRQYLCDGVTGYDGPTGLGTPHGTAAFSDGVTGSQVTLVNPGTQDYEEGVSIGSLDIEYQDHESGSSSGVTCAASGLPAGLSLGPDCALSGTPTSDGSSDVTVSALDGGGATNTVTFRVVVVPNLSSAYHPSAGPVKLSLANLCLDDTANGTTPGAKVQVWTCNGDTAQNWTYVPDGSPGGAGEVTIHGLCADITNYGTADGSKVQLWTCAGTANQQWYIAGAGELVNPVSGRCLDDTGDSTSNGTQVQIWDCLGTSNQSWTPPASPVLSAVAGACVDDTSNSSADGNPIELRSCDGSGEQKWTYEPDGTVRLNGKCLDVTNRSMLDGAPLQLFTCQSTDNANQLWIVGPSGELINANSGRCLADPGDTTASGTQLVQEDCYGDSGEVWNLT